MFARLSAGASLTQADAEVAALGLLAEPAPDERLLARVVPYTFAFTGDFESASDDKEGRVRLREETSGE